MTIKRSLVLFFAILTLAACSSVPLPDAVTLSIPRYDADAKSTTLTWTASTDENFTGYAIYRATATGVDESSTLLTTITDISTLNYEDGFSAKPTEYYYYKVYVENSGGATGSNEVILTGLYIFQFSFGSCGSGDGEFGYPGDVAIDDDGNIYVADSNNDRIQKLDSDGSYLSQWGSGSGDGQFAEPYSIEFGLDGKFYVGDFDNDRVQIFDSSGTYLNEVPVNEAGDSYITSDGHIYASSQADDVIKTFDSSLTPGTDIGAPGSGDGQFDEPWDVAASPDGTKLYVLDQNNNRVQIFQPGGTYVSQFAGAGTDPGQCDDCWGLAVDNYGYVYVTDWTEGKVQIYDEDGVFLEEFVIPAGSIAYGIWGLDFDSDNYMYVVDADNCVVHKYGP